MLVPRWTLRRRILKYGLEDGSWLEEVTGFSMISDEQLAVVDPDPELKGGNGRGGGLYLLALLAFFPSVISSFFPKNKGGKKYHNCRVEK